MSTILLLTFKTVFIGKDDIQRSVGRYANLTSPPVDGDKHFNNQNQHYDYEDFLHQMNLASKSANFMN